MKIVNEFQNKLLNRKEVTFELEFKGKTTPSKTELIKQAAGQVKAKEDLIYVESIDQDYGNTTGSATVYVYDNKENLDKVHFYKKKKLLKQIREKELADRKASKEAVAAPKEEAPAEAPKEEVKAEEKPAEETTNGEESKTEE